MQRPHAHLGRQLPGGGQRAAEAAAGQLQRAQRVGQLPLLRQAAGKQRSSGERAHIGKCQ